jgi:DNA-binding MarR family transcriptional regulator
MVSPVTYDTNTRTYENEIVCIPKERGLSRGPRHNQLVGQLQVALRKARGELVRLNQAVGGRVGMASMDLEVLDLVAQRGPVSPGALAAMAGVSPATMTGILDRLERSGWVRRARDDPDRRRVTIEVLRDRMPAMLAQYRGMQTRLRAVCADYSDEELELITEFLRRVAESGVDATQELRTDTEPES